MRRKHVIGVYCMLGFSLALLVGGGCSKQQNGDGNQPLGEGDDVKRNQKSDPLSVISQQNVSLDELDRALSNLAKREDAKEPPSFWVKLVNDQANTKGHRERCLVAYLRRHLSVPMAVNEVGRMAGIREWFSDQTLWNASRGTGQWVIRPEFGNSQIAFQPVFSRVGRDRLVIVMKVPGRIDVDEFLEFIQGKRTDQEVHISEVGFNVPWENK